MRSLAFSSRPGGPRWLKYQNVPKLRSFWAIGKPRERFQSWDIGVYFIALQLDHTVLQPQCNYEQCIKLVQVHANWSNQFHYLQMFEHTHIVPTRHSCCFLMLCTFRFVFCISIVLCVLDEQLHHIERYANVEFIAFCCYLLVYNFMIVCVFVDLFLNVNFHEVECEQVSTKLSNFWQVSV